VSEPTRPRVLVTNDDGVASEGLWHLAAAAAEAGLDPVIAAPASEASGSGSALYGVWDGSQVEIERTELPGVAASITAYAVRATPAFIAFAAARDAFGFRPRFVLSGINNGPNLGLGVMHSGTVGAALTAAAHGVPAAAFSLDNRNSDGLLEWSAAAEVARQVIAVLLDGPDPGVLNVNVPNVSAERLRGIRRASLATPGVVQVAMAGQAENYLQISMPGPPREPEPGSDSAALAAGYATVTPLRGVGEGSAAGLPWPTAAGGQDLVCRCAAE
jgi:5'-nucleotidase